jgi:predicted RND superfamily exporter protein
LIAWLATVLLVPAYVMMIPERMLQGFGQDSMHNNRFSWLGKMLRKAGSLAFVHARLVLLLMAVLTGVAVWGITRININDNYSRRFSMGHPVRMADIAMNKHFGGTYMAYLVLESAQSGKISALQIENLKKEISDFVCRIEVDNDFVCSLCSAVDKHIDATVPLSETYASVLESTIVFINALLEKTEAEKKTVIEELSAHLGLEREKLRIFKQPEMLSYMADLQRHLELSGLAGKTSSVTDIVRKVHPELVEGRTEYIRVPDSMQRVAECIMQFQQGHRPDDLWHTVTPDFMSANIWVQFKRGDSSLTDQTVRTVEEYMEKCRPPFPVQARWAGLHYVNLVFQNKMFREMLESFIGSFLIVLMMTIILFRSIVWGITCMIPLSFTILATYGIVGLTGHDYDMPVAIMSAISLGISVDFAIHFLERARQITGETKSWQLTIPLIFDEPALAIARNVMVVALGFLPLMVAQLIPYKTTAILLFGVLSCSGLVTLFCLGSLLSAAEIIYFEKPESRQSGPAGGDK